MKYLLAAYSALFLFVAAPAEAKEWKIDYKNSQLTFTGEQAGKPFTGRFSGYVAKVDFDPAAPEKAKIDVTIDMASAKTGDVQRDTALPQKEWFDSAANAQAEFHSSSVKKIDDTHFEAVGKLTIKLNTHDVVLPFTLAPERDGMRAKGEVTVNRTDYGVGTGEWASEEWVAHKVVIGLNLMAY